MSKYPDWTTPEVNDLHEALRLVVGTIVAAAGIACVAAPAPWHCLVLPLVFAGVFVAGPALFRE